MREITAEYRQLKTTPAFRSEGPRGGQPVKNGGKANRRPRKVSNGPPASPVTASEEPEAIGRNTKLAGPDAVSIMREVLGVDS